MKTDAIVVDSSGARMEQALDEVDKVAAYKKLSPKNALHLRLLVEETMGLMRSIAGEREGLFWIEDQDDLYELHLQVRARMKTEKREQLLAVSTSGKNEAAKGLMGRLRNFFDESIDDGFAPMYHANRMYEKTTSTIDWEWRMTQYQNELKKDMETNDQARQMWDELEKSVVTHVADEIKVSIRGPQVEMIILKKMA